MTPYYKDGKGSVSPQHITVINFFSWPITSSLPDAICTVGLHVYIGLQEAGYNIPGFNFIAKYTNFNINVYFIQVAD